MIHEVMVLDHIGPTFGAIMYAASIKLWMLAALLVGIVLPVHTGSVWQDGAVFFCGMLALAVCIGVVESTMARLRLERVPQLLIGAGALSALALVLTFR
jgi:formate hydrogenlyase subunit 4